MAEWGSESWQGGRSTWGVSVWGVCSTRTGTASGLRTWHLLEAVFGHDSPDHGSQSAERQGRSLAPGTHTPDLSPHLCV